MENYKIMEALGSGTWGVVHMAEQIPTKRLVAIKKIKSEKPEEGINFTALREIKILREFKHEHIIELVDCFIHYPSSDSDADDCHNQSSRSYKNNMPALCLVYEVAHTDLSNILSNRSIRISAADTKQHMLSLLKACAAIHERWILHRDLKPDNLLYLKDGTMKLADFGLARMYGTPKVRLSPDPITLWYKPPELLLKSTLYSSSVDIWSCGCIFAELLLRRPFLQGINNTDISQLDAIFKIFGTPNDTNWPNYETLPAPSKGLHWDDCAPIPFEEIFSAAPKDALSLLRSMLVLDPNKRFSASQCLIHPYFDNKPRPTPKEHLIISAGGEDSTT